MKKHILYQRNHKGQYVCGISKAKFICFSLISGIIVYGIASMAYQLSGQKPSIGSEVLSEMVIAATTEEVLGEPCTRIGTHDYFDCTSTATKIRIYELTEGGKKAIKWYGKTKISPVTAYTSRVQETDASPCIAADGSDICKRYANGEKICASNDHKLGSVIDVQGLGKCVVADRMNKRYTGTGRVDWYMGMDLVSARKWGLRHVAVSSL